MRHFWTGPRLGAAALCYGLAEAAGAGGDDKGGAGDDKGGEQQQQQQAAGDWKAPDGMPAEFVGKDAAETLGKVWKGYGELDTRWKGARDTIAALPAKAKSADEFAFTPSEKTKPYFPDGKDDPIMPLAREAAFKHGISPAAFTPFLNSVYEAAIEKGLIGAPFDDRREVNTFKTALGLDDKGTGTALKETEAFATGLFAQLKGIPEAQKKDVQAALLVLTDTAAGNILLRSLQARLNEGGIRVGAGTESMIQGDLSEADLKKLSSDPRIDTANRHHPDADKRYDEDLRKRYDEGYKRLAAAKQ